MPNNPSQLPTTIGEVVYTDHGVTIHGAEERKFSPEHYIAAAAPQSEPPQAAPRAQPPHAFDRPHPPIHLGDLPFAPAAYLVHRHTVECSHCAAVHYTSIVYAYNRLRNRSGTGYVENLSPVQGFAFNVPIKVIDVKPTRVPVCFECAATVSLDHLPTPPAPSRIVGLGNFGQKLQEAAEAKAKAKADKQSTKPTKNLEDLF